MKRLATIAEDNGIVLCHENCSGWGGLSAKNSSVLLGEVDNPALKLVFDTGTGSGNSFGEKESPLLLCPYS